MWYRKKYRYRNIQQQYRISHIFPIPCSLINSIQIQSNKTFSCWVSPSLHGRGGDSTHLYPPLRRWNLMCGIIMDLKGEINWLTNDQSAEHAERKWPLRGQTNNLHAHLRDNHPALSAKLKPKKMPNVSNITCGMRCVKCVKVWIHLNNVFVSTLLTLG